MNKVVLITGANTGFGRTKKMKPPSLLAWYRILRARHHLTIFQAVHYAIWLAR